MNRAGASLQTARLLLREATSDDAYAFRDFMIEAAYWRNLPIDPPGLSSVRAYLEQCERDRTAEPRMAWSLAAIETASGRIVGEGLLRILSTPSRQGEIGWGIAAERSGDGLGTELAAAMLRLGFETLEMHRIVARCRVDNAASRRIMAKLGMREEGVLRDEVFARGAWWTSVLGAILYEEWRSRAGAAQA